VSAITNVAKKKISDLVHYLCTVVPIRKNFYSYTKKKHCSDARMKVKVSLVSFMKNLTS